MPKNIKLNIKNTQIAEALKKFKKGQPKKKGAIEKKKTEEENEVVESTKRKARIVPAVEEKKDEIVENVEKIEKKPKKSKEIETEIPVEEKKEEIVAEKIEKPILETVEKEKPKESKTEVTSPIKKEIIIEEESSEELKKKQFKSFKDFKAKKKPDEIRSFDSQARQGLRSFEEERWRKKRRFKQKTEQTEQVTVRPKNLKIRIPISIKDLAQEMKLKASELIQKLFLQGVILTINDILDDETTVQLLGHEFGCEIQIDIDEEKRLQITEESIKQEIESSNAEDLIIRPPVITFMGHVDHGKTSLIDAIRSSNIAASEAGQITQHIGAFSAKTKYGTITILDTPGHEAFSEMRTRGANVTDIVVLVVAGDEGIKPQTVEAIKMAKEANVPILVALNKSDKPAFDQERVYRQLSDNDLLVEAWGGTTLTVNCSAQTKQGISDLLEMLSLQAEILELKANPKNRARGTILESQMHKGLGPVATILVQNGTLRVQDAVVFTDKYARIKTMHDQYNNQITEAGPSTPVKITGLSDLAEAGSDFIVVSNEKEAKDLADARREKIKFTAFQKSKKFSLESMKKADKKIFHLIIRADVQGSLEALKQSLLKIHSDKIDLNIVSSEVGEVSESDIRLAYASSAVILGFHTKIESHAESLIKELKVVVRQHNIIYHAIDEVKELMRSSLDKLERENDTGKAKVLALFRSSQVGLIAGCIITDGIIRRNSFVRIIRNGELFKKTKVISLKREKDDVKEVKSGLECGIVLQDSSEIQKEDIIEAYDITYLEQEL